MISHRAANVTPRQIRLIFSYSKDMTISFNYKDGEIVSSPTVILSGSSIGAKQGIVQVINNNASVFPPQYFEINNGNFKAIVNLSSGENNFIIETITNASLSASGLLVYEGVNPNVIESKTLSLRFNPLVNNKPIHLCLIVGRDSDGSYDMPKYKTNRGEKSNLETAIKRLKVAGRMMQAYTQDELRSVGLSNRSFQFVEEDVYEKQIFGNGFDTSKPHKEVKVHVIRSPKSVADLRDPNLAQQNPNASDNGGLFSHAIELIENSLPEYGEYRKRGTPIQCAVIYLDSKFDSTKKLILTHAALGGGTGMVKLAIFGSHGIHSWPMSFPLISPSFMDSTVLTTKEVANDANQCGTSWECLNITMGAFMHEIGHSLGSPHQVDGVMLRDYIWWNRSFMTRESRCLRTNSNGQLIFENGTWPQVCHWNYLDLMRYIYHDSFSLPIDSTDPGFKKVYSTIYNKSDNTEGNAPTFYKTPQGAVIKSNSGIYLIELVSDDLARFHIPFYPRVYGGSGLPFEYKLDFQSCFNSLKSRMKHAKENFDIRVLSLAGDLYINDFKSACSDDKSIIRSDFGLGNGIITGYKTGLLGQSKGNPEVMIGFDIKSIFRVRIYHGNALDGIEFFYADSSSYAPSIPPRNYLNKVARIAMVNANSRKQKTVLIGNRRPHYSDFELQQGDYISKFHVRNGAWIDGVQIELNNGTRSQMYGNTIGGHLSTLETPGDDSSIVGLYGHVGSWLDGLGLIYTFDSL